MTAADQGGTRNPQERTGEGGGLAHFYSGGLCSHHPESFPILRKLAAGILENSWRRGDSRNTLLALQKTRCGPPGTG